MIGDVACTTLRHTTMFTYSHANTPLGQSERAYYLSYFIKCPYKANTRVLLYGGGGGGNRTVDNLQRVLRLQERCARLILDADTHENSVKRFNKLDWLPIDDSIGIGKLCMLHKINQGHCPAYFNNYIEY